MCCDVVNVFVALLAPVAALKIGSVIFDRCSLHFLFIFQVITILFQRLHHPLLLLYGLLGPGDLLVKLSYGLTPVIETVLVVAVCHLEDVNQFSFVLQCLLLEPSLIDSPNNHLPHNPFELSHIVIVYYCLDVEGCQ